MIKFKRIGEYSFLYNSELEIDKSLFDSCVEYMYNNPRCGVLAPQIVCGDKTLVHNYRTFPSIMDLVIKNFSFLRTKFPSRMRRFLLWDLRMDAVSNVDFVTSDFMCIQTSLLSEMDENLINKNFFDLRLCAKAWKAKLEVCYNPLIKLGSSSTPRKRNLVSKINMLFSAFGLQAYLWFAMWNVDCPSRNYQTSKQLLMNAHKINSRSYLANVGGNFQKKNKVVQVYEGNVEGVFSYKQPLVFCYDGVVAVIKNKQGDYGLIKIWRHAPLKESVPNLFPVFPDTQDLGIYSYECVRGGGEKYDNKLETSILRELKEEINLDSKNIKSIKRLSTIVSNTAWDVNRAFVFLVEINGDFDVSVQRAESIESFAFYSKKEILQMIRENKIVCGYTKAALLEDILAND